MTNPQNFDAFDVTRIQPLIEELLAELEPEDRAERVAWCQVSGRHGVVAHREGEGFRLEWGDKPLGPWFPREVLAYGGIAPELS